VALTAQPLNWLDHAGRSWSIQTMRSRAAILQSSQTIAAIPLNPFVNGPRADACGFTDGFRRLPARDPQNDPLSTTWR
jgi:hypothetical protein